MTTLTNFKQDVPELTAPPDVYRPRRVSHASTGESLASVEDIQEQKEKLPPLERLETMSSVHFLLAHQPSRRPNPGHIVERKREHTVQITNASQRQVIQRCLPGSSTSPLFANSFTRTGCLLRNMDGHLPNSRCVCQVHVP